MARTPDKPASGQDSPTADAVVDGCEIVSEFGKIPEEESIINGYSDRTITYIKQIWDRSKAIDENPNRLIFAIKATSHLEGLPNKEKIKKWLGDGDEIINAIQYVFGSLDNAIQIALTCNIEDLNDELADSNEFTSE